MSDTKTVFQTDRHGVFVFPTTAFASPLEPGKFLIPAGCVDAPPPPCEPGTRARWAGGEWLLEAWEPPAPPDPARVLADFLAANPGVAALVMGGAAS